jgi:hypothetical protein
VNLPNMQPVVTGCKDSHFLQAGGTEDGMTGLALPVFGGQAFEKSDQLKASSHEIV